MMSNPPSSLQQRQRLHRRQNSTPVVAFEAMKVTGMPPQRQNLHRRGQSFDLQRSPIRKLQAGNSVSMTNIGSIHGQQILREAQQQRIARPGQQQPNHNTYMEQPLSADCGMFQMPSSSIPGTPYDDMSMNAMMQQAQQEMHFAHSQQPYFSDMNMQMQNFALPDENNPQIYSENQHAQSRQILQARLSFDGRRMSQPDLRVQTQMRPNTPSQQIQTAQFPLTPPFSQHTPNGQYSRSQQASPALHSPFPVPMARGRSLQGIIENEEFKPDLVSQTNGPSFEVADMPVPESRRHVQNSPTRVKQEPIKVEPDFSLEDTDSQIPSLEDQPAPVLTSDGQSKRTASPGRPCLSPRRMSISDLNLEPGVEASIEETNVTLDDIAQFIEGPDPADNKWVCKYEDCNKRFGRKENIKSHVQTHLGDRQFRCDHCKKCFVRGHDLKRHAKIHTGTKPYPCLCGNSFARHDALTRHRQRGMCIGAFDGVVKKVIKRGRPRKHRPEMDDRVDKASRTRQAAQGFSQDAYNSSASSCSMSSWGSPPTEIMESLSIRGISPPFESMPLFSTQASSASVFDQTFGFPPENFSFTPPASPGYSTGNKPSPSQTYRSLTPAEIVEIATLSNGDDILPLVNHGIPLMSDTDALSLHPSGHSLPSLSHSSSSPAADVVAFDYADMDASEIQISQGMKMEERNDFDSFLDYGNMEMGLQGGEDFFANL